MALPDAWTTLNSELDLLSNVVREFAAKKAGINSASDFTIQDECLLEGLLSRIWQTWCNFCRSCVIESCIGTIDGAGVTIPPLPGATTAEHVSGAAIRANRKTTKPPYSYWQGGPNTLLRVEPTWGDVDVLANVLPRLRPKNFAKLLAAFSSGSSSAKALQLIRNGTAHNNVQSLAEIQALRSRYMVFPIGHPTHSLFWIEPHSKDFLPTQAIEDLKDAGFAAIY